MKSSSLQILQLNAKCMCACMCMLVCYFFIPGENKGFFHAFCQHKGPLPSRTWFSSISFFLITGLTSLSLFTLRSFLGLPLIYPSLHAPQMPKPPSLQSFVFWLHQPGTNSSPLQWKLGVLTAGPPENSQSP